MHKYEWFWHNETMWDYLFPESRTMNLGVINIHMVWRPMSLPESGLWKTWESVVSNQHVAKCVKACLRNIGAFKSQNDMGTGQGEYCLSIFVHFRIIAAWNISKLVHKVILKATNCTVMGWNWGQSKLGGNTIGKHRGGKKRKSLWMHVVQQKIIEIILCLVHSKKFVTHLVYVIGWCSGNNWYASSFYYSE